MPEVPASQPSAQLQQSQLQQPQPQQPQRPQALLLMQGWFARVNERIAQKPAAQLALQALVIFLTWRLSLLALEFVGLTLLPDAGQCRKQWNVFQDSYYWNGFFRWDAAWYSNLARNGYHFYDERSSTAAFFPVTAYGAKAFGAVVGDLHVGALIFVHFCTLGTIAGMLRLSAQLLGNVKSGRAALLLLLFPTSFYLKSFYSEAPFLLFATWSMSAFLSRNFLLAGVFGALTVLTRSTGIVLLPAFILDIAFQRLRGQAALSWRMLWLLLLPASLGGFMFFLEQEVEDPLAFVNAQVFWRDRSGGPWTAIRRSLRGIDWSLPRHALNTQRIAESFFTLSMLGIGVAMLFRRWRLCLSVFALGALLLPLFTGTLMSTLRFSLVEFPCFLFLAQVLESRPNLERYYLCVSTFLLAIFSIRFMGCAWVG